MYGNHDDNNYTHHHQDKQSSRCNAFASRAPGMCFLLFFCSTNNFYLQLDYMCRNHDDNNKHPPTPSQHQDKQGLRRIKQVYFSPPLPTTMTSMTFIAHNAISRSTTTGTFCELQLRGLCPRYVVLLSFFNEYLQIMHMEWELQARDVHCVTTITLG